MSKHAAGPWAVTGESRPGRYIKVQAANGRTVARVPFSSEAEGDAGTATDASDAHLVAAAPDMRAALMVALAYLSPRREDAFAAAALEVVESALSKAEGRA